MYDPATYDRPSDQPTAPAHDHSVGEDCPDTCPAHPAGDDQQPQPEQETTGDE